jgi:glycosyltransferase involved in cell wall biosynthesis
MGELDHRKGSLVLLDALDDLGDGPGSSIWSAIAGRGVLEDVVRQRALDNGAFFLGGLKFPGGVQDFFRSMDIICVPSRTTSDWNEQSPRVVIEAMMSGCLVVVSDCGANPEMVGDQGLVVPEGDPEGLRMAILSAVELVRRGNHLGRAASIRARQLYSSDAVAEKLMDTWGEALQRRRSLSSV